MRKSRLSAHTTQLQQPTTTFSMDTSDPFDQYPHPSAKLPLKLSEYFSQLHPNLTSVVSLLGQFNDRNTLIDKLTSLSEPDRLRLSCGLLKLSSASLSLHRLLFSTTLAATSLSVARAHQEVIASHELHREKLARLEPEADIFNSLTNVIYFHKSFVFIVFPT